jgi:hypothetical protein
LHLQTSGWTRLQLPLQAALVFANHKSCWSESSVTEPSKCCKILSPPFTTSHFLVYCCIWYVSCDVHMHLESFQSLRLKLLSDVGVAWDSVQDILVVIIAVIEWVLEWMWSMGRRQSTVVQRGGCAVLLHRLRCRLPSYVWCSELCPLMLTIDCCVTFLSPYLHCPASWLSQ